MVNNEARGFLDTIKSYSQSVWTACEAMTVVPDAKDLKRTMLRFLLTISLTTASSVIGNEKG